MKNVIKPSAKSILIPLGLTQAASAADPEKRLGSWTTTLIIWNDEMKDIIKIVKSLEDSGLSLKEFSEIIHHEVKEQNRGFLSMLLGTLGESLLRNMLAGKGINAAREGFRIPTMDPKDLQSKHKGWGHM